MAFLILSAPNGTTISQLVLGKLCCLYLQSCSFSHYPKLVTLGKGRDIDRLVHRKSDLWPKGAVYNPFIHWENLQCKGSKTVKIITPACCLSSRGFFRLGHSPALEWRATIFHSGSRVDNLQHRACMVCNASWIIHIQDGACQFSAELCYSSYIVVVSVEGCGGLVSMIKDKKNPVEYILILTVYITGLQFLHYKPAKELRQSNTTP